MKRVLYLLLTALFFTTSCSTVKIASNKQAGYTSQPKKIYIVVKCEKDANIFCNGLLQGVKRNFAQKGIETGSFIQDPLSLENESSIQEKIGTFNPEAVLLIQQSVTGYDKGTFEITLMDYNTRKNVWKSELDVSADSYTSLEDNRVINKSINALIEKLVQDKLI